MNTVKLMLHTIIKQVILTDFDLWDLLPHLVKTAPYPASLRAFHIQRCRCIHVLLSLLGFLYC